MQLWWRKPAPAPQSPTPPPAASAPVVDPPPAWTQVPALQRVVTPTPAIAPLDTFVGSLSTRQNPSFLAPLAHAVDSSAPGGSVSGLVHPGVPQQAQGGLDLLLRSPSTAGTKLQRSVQTAVSSLPDVPSYSMPVSSPPPTAELTTAPHHDIDRVLPTVHSAEPVSQMMSLGAGADQTTPSAPDVPLAGGNDAERSAPDGGESSVDAAPVAMPLPSLPLASPPSSTTATGLVVSRSIDTSSASGSPGTDARPRFEVQPPIDLARVDHPLLGEPATTAAQSPLGSADSGIQPAEPIQPLPLSGSAAPTVARLAGDHSAAVSASRTPTVSPPMTTSQATQHDLQSTPAVTDGSSSDPVSSTTPPLTAPTVGLAAPLPVQTHSDLDQGSAPVSHISQPVPPTAPARRGLGAPLPPEGTSVQRQVGPGAAATGPGGGAGTGGAGRTALVGLAHMLDQVSSSASTAASPALPLQQIVQRSARFDSDADSEPLASPSPEQTEPTFSEPDAPLVGDGPVMTSAGTVDTADEGVATHDGIGNPPSPDLILTSAASAASGPQPGHASSPMRSGVPLQRYAGADSISTPAPITGPTAPLIGDLPQLAVLTGAEAAGPTEEQLQRVVEAAVPVRYGPPPRPESSGASDGGAVARSLPYATSTPTTSVMLVEHPQARSGSGYPSDSGAQLQRISGSAFSTASAGASPSQPGRPGRTGNPAVQRFGQPAQPALVVARSPDPGQAAISAGVARPDGANSVVFDQPFAPPEMPVGAPEVQRAPEAPTTTSIAAPMSTGEASPAPDINELAQRLFDPLSARLKTELWLDRERAGFVTDLRR